MDKQDEAPTPISDAMAELARRTVAAAVAAAMQEAPIDYPTGYDWCGNTWAMPDFYDKASQASKTD
ncbi:MAG: hypothetical protein WB438_04280 [Candidatus Cybelea sp.]